MPYVVTAQSARWVDPSEGYALQSGESFAAAPPTFVRLPTPLDNIRTAEAAANDRFVRASRLAALESGRNKVKSLPGAVGKTDAEIHAWCYAADADYHALYDLEQYCAAQRKLIV